MVLSIVLVLLHSIFNPRDTGPLKKTGFYKDVQISRYISSSGSLHTGGERGNKINNNKSSGAKKKGQEGS